MKENFEIFFVRGEIEVYVYGSNSKFYLREYVEAPFAALARRIAIQNALERISRKFGKSAKVKLGKILVRPASREEYEKAKKRTKRNKLLKIMKRAQPSLF